MTDWYTDERTVKVYGDFSVVSQQHKRTGDTAHLIVFPSGHGLRVLPDGTSGQRRSKAVKAVLETVERLRDVPGDLRGDVILGGLARQGLEWELIRPDLEVTPAEWVTAWFESEGAFDGSEIARRFMEALKVDGWEIRRAE